MIDMLKRLGSEIKKKSDAHYSLLLYSFHTSVAILLIFF